MGSMLKDQGVRNLCGSSATRAELAEVILCQDDGHIVIIRTIRGEESARNQPAQTPRGIVLEESRSGALGGKSFLDGKDRQGDGIAKLIGHHATAGAVPDDDLICIVLCYKGRRRLHDIAARNNLPM